MKKLIGVKGGVTLVGMDARGQICGFVCRRPCIQDNSHQIGPLYADDAITAKALLQAVCADIKGQTVTLHIRLANLLL